MPQKPTTKTYICVRCGVEFSPSKPRKNPQYCSRSCFFAGARENARIVECAQCGKPFSPNMKQSKYCSVGCYGLTLRVLYPARQCPSCGGHFTPLPSSSGGYAKAVYCSNECRSIARRNRVDVTCKACGKSFVRAVSQTKNGKSQYCSMDCARPNRYRSSQEDLAVSFVTQVLGEQPERAVEFPEWLVWRGRMRLDAYYAQHRLVVEYDGRHHFEFHSLYHETPDDLLLSQERDRIKNELCAQQGLAVLRIRYDEPNTLEHIEQRVREALSSH